MHFDHYLPVHLIFGAGQINQLGTETARLGKRALLVVGKHSAQASGLLDRVLTLMSAQDVDVLLYDNVPQNPLTTTVEEGAVLAIKHRRDVVVGIGGGSIMDAAKGIAFMAKNPGHVSEYIFGKAGTGGALPLLMVPTTCGTGSEANAFSVLTHPETLDKKSLRSESIIPKVAIVDPNLMKTLPKPVLAAVGIDAFCHNMEGFISRNAQPLTDMMALRGMRLISKSLPALYKNSGNDSDWDNLAWASTMGGMVIGSAGITAGHALEHPISGLKNIVHGLGLAAITPAILTQIAEKGVASERMNRISRTLGGSGAMDCTDAFRRFTRSVDASPTLTDLGITESDVPWLVENCLKVSVAGVSLHPAHLTASDIAGIYRASLR